MDKSWIDEKDRFSSKYTAGVESFIQFSRKNIVEFDNKILCPNWLGYTKIDACKYDCALFWKENENENFCPVCKISLDS
ncbi:hypothetical protein ACJIZ3_021514 [Penstemon smallii]|uniref:Transposase-associated domain-containing protein n=1 Tax=Penstemon smallii TaxID=265156 RepID=A0ABD3SLN4_9LAMI